VICQHAQAHNTLSVRTCCLLQIMLSCTFHRGSLCSHVKPDVCSQDKCSAKVWDRLGWLGQAGDQGMTISDAYSTCRACRGTAGLRCCAVLLRNAAACITFYPDPHRAVCVTAGACEAVQQGGSEAVLHTSREAGGQ
jgi:hypothetical protein